MILKQTFWISVFEGMLLSSPFIGPLEFVFYKCLQEGRLPWIEEGISTWQVPQCGQLCASWLLCFCVVLCCVLLYDVFLCVCLCCVYFILWTALCFVAAGLWEQCQDHQLAPLPSNTGRTLSRRCWTLHTATLNTSTLQFIDEHKTGGYALHRIELDSVK